MACNARAPPTLLATRPCRASAPRSTPRPAAGVAVRRRGVGGGSRLVCCAQTPPEPEESPSPAPSPSVEDTTRQWGLEAGLWKVFTSKDKDGAATKTGEKMSQAKELLKRYGSAYLITSISLSIVSFSLSYVLISAGVDVASLLDKVGITVSATSEQVGVFALAYAVHKAASPIRFPPTVALTPLVARWMGKEVQ